MSARIIDLTEDSSDGEPAAARSSSHLSMMPQALATRQPLNAIQNGSRVNARPAPALSQVLKKAIDTMDVVRLRTYLHQYCQTIPELRQSLERDLLVKGKDVARYHRDTDSEDNVNSQNESSEEEVDEDDDGNVTEREKTLEPIPIGDEDFAPRYAKCENCEEEFDVSHNDAKECKWHIGEKELYEDDDFWADHDDQCHGDPSSFEDDPDYADGFKWDCCGNLGDHEGCKTTKHKAAVNVIQSAGFNKRRAEEEIQRPILARCETCGNRYNVMQNSSLECIRHPGHKVIDIDSEHWVDWDDQCHGNPEDVIDDPDHADGFLWSCCYEGMGSLGCVKARHEPQANGYRY